MKTLLIFVFSFLILTHTAFAQTQAEQLRQMVAQLEANRDDNALRERIIKFAATMKPPPPIPEEAERRMARGNAAYKAAKSVADYQEAANEFTLAIRAAPWYGNAYFNNGLMQDKAGDYDFALVNLKLALLSTPDDKRIKDLIYEVEYRSEKAFAAKAEAALQGEIQRAAQDRLAREKAEHDALLVKLTAGKWIMHTCHGAGNDSHMGCTESEKGGSSWYMDTKGYGSNEPREFEFLDPANGAMRLPYLIGECGNDSNGDLAVYGVPEGASFASIRWEVRRKDGTGSARQIYSKIAYDGSRIEFSCDRPLSGARPDVRYHYTIFSRTEKI